MNQTNKQIMTHTAIGELFRITHTGVLKVNTEKGILKAKKIVTLEIQETVLSVHEMTRDGKAIIFKHDAAFAVTEAQEDQLGCFPIKIAI